MSFPERLDVAPGRPFVVRVDVASPANRQRVLRLVEPDTCYAASVSGYTRAADPPSWTRLERSAAPEAAQSLGTIAPIALAPGERRSYEVAFEEAIRASSSPEWRPRERFSVTVGLVVHTFDDDLARPLRWLRRDTATYLITGERVAGAGELRYERWEWPRMSTTEWSPRGYGKT